MNAIEFISVATQLLAGEGEGRLRSAVSRAYYGAFHVARQFLFDCGVIVPIDSAAHRNVRWCLGSSSEPPIVEAGRRLEALRSTRNNADYDLATLRFTQSLYAKAQVERAVEIVGLLSPYQTETVRAKVAPTIRSYAATLRMPLRNLT